MRPKTIRRYYKAVKTQNGSVQFPPGAGHFASAPAISPHRVRSVLRPHLKGMQDVSFRVQRVKHEDHSSSTAEVET